MDCLSFLVISGIMIDGLVGDFALTNWLTNTCCFFVGDDTWWFLASGLTCLCFSILGNPQWIRTMIWLVVYLPIWKIWKSVGIMKFPIYGKIKFIFQTTSQCMNQFSHGMLRCLLAHRKLAMSSHRVQVILFPRGTLYVYIYTYHLVI